MPEDHTRELLGARIDALDRLIQVRLESVESATELARQEMDRRLEGMNDLQSRFRDLIPRNEYFTAHQSLSDKFEMAMKSLDVRVATLEKSGAGVSSRIGTTKDFLQILIPIVAILVAIGAALFAGFHR